MTHTYSALLVDSGSDSKRLGQLLEDRPPGNNLESYGVNYKSEDSQQSDFP